MIDYVIQVATQHVDLYALTATLAAILYFKIERFQAAALLEAERTKTALKELDRKVMFLWDVIGRRATDKLSFLTTEWERKHEHDQRSSDKR